MPYHLEINKVSNFWGALHEGTVPVCIGVAGDGSRKHRTVLE